LFDINLSTPEEAGEDAKPPTQTFEEPKVAMNMSNLVSYELKKDQKVELVESKKGIFSSTKKVVIKMGNHDDL
jgi:hypothetical protein